MGYPKSEPPSGKTDNGIDGVEAMKIILMRSAIHDTLNRLARIITTKSTMPVLGHILLKAENGVFSLASTNLEMDARSPVSADIDEPGMFAVPGERLAAIVAALADDARITIDTTDDKLTLKSGRARYNLTTLGADAFPNWAIEGDWTHQFTIPSKDLFRVISTVSPFAMADDKTQLNIMAVYLECADNRIIAMATDAKRMVYAEAEISRGESVKMLINIDAAKELCHLLDKIGGDVAVYGCATKVSFKFATGFVFTTRLIDATFPTVAEKVITAAESNPNIVIADGKMFKAMITRLMAMASETRTAIFFTIENNMIDAVIRHPEHGDATDGVECEYDGQKLVIGFQIQYLRQLIDALDADTVRIKINDGVSPTFWHPVGNNAVKFVQMTRVGT